MILDLFLESYSDHHVADPSSWTDVAGDDYMSRNLEEGSSALDAGAIFAYCLCSCSVAYICIARVCADYENEQARPRSLESPLTRQERERRELDALEGGETRKNNNEKSTVEYMAFFSDAFEKNNQQQTLLSSHLLEGDPTKMQGGEMNDKDQNLETINSALSSARSYRLSSGDNGDDDSSVIYNNQNSLTRRNKSMCLFHPHCHGFDGKTKNIIGVHCAICLDDIQAEETIVWSETESCPHIFHKKCLIPFLAFNKEGQLKLPPHRRHKVQNPCPTCRQSFITLDPEEALA